MAHSAENLLANALDERGPTKDALGEREVVCDKHGSYIATGMRYFGRREVWTPCPDCVEARLASERQEQAEREAAAKRQRIEKAIGDAAIPRRFVGRTLGNFVTGGEHHKERALRLSREFAENFERHFEQGTGLIFSGLPGTGKSHLAAAILQELMPEYVGLYATCMGLIRAVRGTWRRDSERSESELLDMLAEVPLLALDEVGVQYGTDGEQTILFDVLDRRYRDMRPTILLTNQDSQGLKTFIGERSYDRLVETSRWVAFDWDSYRPVARKATA